MLEGWPRTEGCLQVALVSIFSARSAVVRIRVNPVADEAQRSEDFSDELDTLGVGQLDSKEGEYIHVDDLEPFGRSKAGRPVFNVEAVECSALGAFEDSRYEAQARSSADPCDR